MIALIVKELRCYARQRRYRRIQFVIMCLLAFTLFTAAFELFAQSQTSSQIDVGSGIYSILVIVFFIAILCFAVPLQGIEAIQIEKRSANLDLLTITPINAWKLLAGKLIGAIIAALWSVWLATPLFWLSIYTGGLTLRQLFACGLVFIAGNALFLMIGISFTLFGNPIHARSRSYAAVLSITLLPLILSHTIRFEQGALDLLHLLSPLCALLSIIRSEKGSIAIWLWMTCFYLLLFALMFGISGRRMVKRDSTL